MDAVRFLSFLQSFAATASARVAAQPASGESLQSTLSDFEAQLRSLMQQPSGDARSFSTPSPALRAESVPAAQVLSHPADSAFVIGGGSGSAGGAGATTVATASAGNSEATSSTASTASTENAAITVSASAGTTPVKAQQSEPTADEIRKIIDWQKDQLHPMLNVRIGDIWARQGITDPQKDPAVIAQAHHVFERGVQVRQINTAALLPWQQPWQSGTTMVAVNTSDPSGFVIGGRG